MRNMENIYKSFHKAIIKMLFYLWLSIENANVRCVCEKFVILILQYFLKYIFDSIFSYSIIYFDRDCFFGKCLL